MISGSGAKMQCTSYLPGCYYSVDHNVVAGGSLWQLLNNGVNYKSRMAYNTLLEPHSSNLSDKEVLSQTMLNHEAIFRNQVQELHRLYLRQRELMDVTNVRELSQYDLQRQTSEFGSPSKSLNSRKRILDLELPAEEYIDIEEREGSGEENSIEVPQVGYGSSKTPSESYPKIHLKLNEGPSSNFNSSCSKGSYLFDLNEPMQLDDSVTPNYTSFVGTNISCMDFVPEDQDLSGKSTSKSLVLNEEITYNILEKKGNEGSTLISDLQLSFAEKSALSCDDRTSMCREFVKTSSELIDNNNQSILTSCITNSCSLVPFPDEVKTEASNSGSSQRMSFRNSRENPVAFPCSNAPKFLQTSRSSPSNCGIQRKYFHLMKASPCSWSLGRVMTSRTSNRHSNNAAEEHTVSRSSKDSKHRKSSVCMDLNVMSQGYFPASEENIKRLDGKNSVEDSQGQFETSRVKQDYDGEFVRSPSISETPDSSNRFSALISNTSWTKSSKDKNILSSEKTGAISSCLVSNSSGKSNTYDRDGFVIANKTGEELSKSSICIHVDDSSREHPVSNAATQMINKMATGTILEAPVSPDNHEQSPPREESDDSQIGMPLHFSKQKTGDPNNDFDRIAAETIISISFSGVEQCLKTAPIGLLEASSDCLDWFAGIVASVTVDSENEFEGLLNDSPVDSNLVAPNGMGQLKGTKVDHCCETSKQKNKEVPGILFSSQQESGLGRKGRRRKKFQSEGLSCISSPSSCNVTENLQPIQKLITAASNTRGTILSRKNIRRSCHARISRKSTSFYANLMKRSVRSLLRQHNNKTDCSFLPCCLHGWGKKNRRQKSRRARTINKFSFG